MRRSRVAGWPPPLSRSWRPQASETQARRGRRRDPCRVPASGGWWAGARWPDVHLREPGGPGARIGPPALGRGLRRSESAAWAKHCNTISALHCLLPRGQGCSEHVTPIQASQTPMGRYCDHSWVMGVGKLQHRAVKSIAQGWTGRTSPYLKASLETSELYCVSVLCQVFCL